MKKRLKHFVFMLALVALGGVVVILVLSPISLLISDGNKLDAFLKLARFCLIWFILPVMVMPFLELIYPDKDDSAYFYSAAAFYYGGAIISNILNSLLVGYLIALILLHLYFVKIAE